MASDRHDPEYYEDDQGCIVKCSCGWMRELSNKAKAMSAWAKHHKEKRKSN